ncbi:MAG: hypothetical protein LBI79_08005 [Nitrososphaerota archaeon]|nr:hypothetical protein [Nitrososphaerota archaeon]
MVHCVSEGFNNNRQPSSIRTTLIFSSPKNNPTLLIDLAFKKPPNQHDNSNHKQRNKGTKQLSSKTSDECTRNRFSSK